MDNVPNTAIYFIIINRQCVDKNRKLFSLSNLKIPILIPGFQMMYYLVQTKKSSYLDQEKTRKTCNNVYISKVFIIL